MDLEKWASLGFRESSVKKQLDDSMFQNLEFLLLVLAPYLLGNVPRYREHCLVRKFTCCL